MTSFSFFHLALLALIPVLLFAWIGGIGVLAIKRRWGWMAGLFALGLAWPLWILVMVLHPFGPPDCLRILARAEADDHTQLLLTQARNPTWGMPYTVACWVQPPGKPWGCMMIDLESPWWPAGKILIRDRHALVLHGGEQELDYDMENNAYTLADTSEKFRPLWIEDGWEPREGGEFRMVMEKAYDRGMITAEKPAGIEPRAGQSGPVSVKPDTRLSTSTREVP